MREVTYECLKHLKGIVKCLYFVDQYDNDAEHQKFWLDLAHRDMESLVVRMQDATFLARTSRMANFAVGQEYFEDYSNPRRYRNSYFEAIKLLRDFGFPPYVYLIPTQGTIESLYADWHGGEPTDKTQVILKWFLWRAQSTKKVVRSIQCKFWNRLKHQPELKTPEDVYNVWICPETPEGKTLTSIFEVSTLHDEEILVISPDKWLDRLDKLINHSESKALLKKYDDDFSDEDRTLYEREVKQFEEGEQKTS